MIPECRERLAHKNTLIRKVLYICACLVGIGFNIWIADQNRAVWGVDFIQFLAAGRLAGSGNLYDWPLLQSVEAEYGGKPVPTGRLPVFALAYKPLTYVPYTWARGVWFLVCLGAAALAVAVWPDRRLRYWLALALCWSMPLALGLGLGQEDAIFLLFFSLGLRLLTSKRDIAAGFLLSLCACKFHLAGGIGFLVIAHQRRRCVLAGIAGIAILIALSTAIEGWNWHARWINMSRLPEFDPAFQRMPNLRGALGWFTQSIAAEMAAGVLIAAVTVLRCRNLTMLAAAPLALSAGMLLGHHGYTYDAILLLPLAATILSSSAPPLLWAWAALIISPAPYLVLLSNYPVLGQILIVGFVLAALVSPWSVRHARETEVGPFRID